MAQKEEAMDKNELIKVLATCIQEVAGNPDRNYEPIEGKIRFRYYQRDQSNENKLHKIDITIEV